MESVIVSIKPEWLEKIIRGEKTIEVRKSAPKEVPFRAYIYETKHATEMPWVDEDGHFIYKGRGQVIGEFICDEVYNIEPIFSFYDCYSGYNDTSDRSYFEGYSIDNERLKKTCLTQQDLCVYGKEKPLYGWHISDLKIYDKPKNLSEFFGECPNYKDLPAYNHVNCNHCRYSYNINCFIKCQIDGRKPLTRPPQSWQYLY